MNSSQMDLGELVIFQPVLQAYPTRHILDYYHTHIAMKFGMPLETLQQTTYQNTISQISGSTSSTPTQLLSSLQLGLSNIQDIYSSGESTKTSAIKLLQSNQPQTHIHCRRSLLPFLGDALSWLTGTATTKDICSIKTWINQLIAT